MNTNVRVGITYIVLSLAFLSYTGLLTYQRHNPSRVAFSRAPAGTDAETIESIVLNRKHTVYPVRIVSTDLRIDLPVARAKVKDGEWDLTEQDVMYLASSPVPGTQGNSILYGHNWPGLLGNLRRAVPGQSIDIVNSDGSKHRFTIEKTAVLSPDNYTVLNNTADTRITIYTCTGFLDAKRFVATAKRTN